MNRMMPWRDGYWNCSPLMISRGMKLYPTFPCLVTWNRLNSCQVCWPFSLLVINLIFSSAEPSSSVYPPTYMPIYSETISLIPSSSPLRVMKVILTNDHSITKFSNPPPHLSYPLCTQFLILDDIFIWWSCLCPDKTWLRNLISNMKKRICWTVLIDL